MQSAYPEQELQNLMRVCPEAEYRHLCLWLATLGLPVSAAYATQIPDLRDNSVDLLRDFLFNEAHRGDGLDKVWQASTFQKVTKNSLSLLSDFLNRVVEGNVRDQLLIRVDPDGLVLTLKVGKLYQEVRVATENYSWKQMILY